jgi:long-subunit fatty acid transport protein
LAPFGDLEASAYVARANDPTAVWFNPAGLSRAAGAQITGSAGLYQFTTVSPRSSANTGGSTQVVPNVVGFTVKTHKLTLGAALVTTLSWQQETDTQIIDTAGNPERFAYSADSNLTQRVMSLAVGYDSQGKWRFGAGLGLSYTSARMVQATSDRIADPTDLRTLLVSSRLTGLTLQLQPVLGMQFDPSESVRIGAVARTAGLPIIRVHR